jgi:signal transduction histidine kinase
MSEEVSRLTNLVSGLTSLDEAPGESAVRPVSAKTLVERAIGSIQAAAAARNIAIERRIEPGLRTIWVDPDQAQQLFANT